VKLGLLSAVAVAVDMHFYSVVILSVFVNYAQPLAVAGTSFGACID
jgi:hypothetical protein